MPDIEYWFMLPIGKKARILSLFESDFGNCYFFVSCPPLPLIV
jgi:hypothetical protein